MNKKYWLVFVSVLCLLGGVGHANGESFESIKARLQMVTPESAFEIGQIWKDLGIKIKADKNGELLYGCVNQADSCVAEGLHIDYGQVEDILNYIQITKTWDSQILFFDAKSGAFAGHSEYRIQKYDTPMVEYLGENALSVTHLAMTGTGIQTKEADIFVFKNGKVGAAGSFITEHYRSGWGWSFDAEIRSKRTYKHGELAFDYVVVVTPADDHTSDADKKPRDNALRTKRKIVAQMGPNGILMKKGESSATPKEIKDLAYGGEAEYSRFYGEVFDAWMKGQLNETCGVFRYFHEYTDSDGQGIKTQIPGVDEFVRVKRADEIRTLKGLGTDKASSDVPNILIPPSAFPLRVGSKWPDADAGIDPRDRSDKMYYNYVEKIEDVAVPAGTFKKCFKIVYRGIPDETAVWYCPGTGVVKAEYHHHGTVDNRIIELKEYCSED